MKTLKRPLLLSLILILLFTGNIAVQESGEAQAAEMKIETIKTDSFSMDYFRFGRGKGTFVILPGLSVQSVMGFADAVAEAYQIFSDEYTVYVFDRRKELPAEYTVYQMAQDTAEAFRALGLDHVDLFGASQGGMIAMEIAVEQPDLVRKLVLGSTAANVGEARYQTVENWIRMAKAGDKEGLYLAFGEAIYPKAVYEQSRELLIESAKTVTDEDLERFVILAEGMKDFDASNDLEKISCPVFVIGSMDDQVLGSDAAGQIAEHFGGRDDFELYMYDGYGHAVYDTAPDYKERILHFLEEKASD